MPGAEPYATENGVMVAFQVTNGQSPMALADRYVDALIAQGWTVTSQRGEDLSLPVYVQLVNPQYGEAAVVGKRDKENNRDVFTVYFVAGVRG